MAETAPLSAPLDIGFDYTRSLGPVLGRFMTGLSQRRIEGVRGSDGRVHVPPVEFDPITAEPLSEFVDVAAEGEVVSWSWCPEPVPGQPLQQPFAWALIRLDGADTAMLHAVAATTADVMRTGMRVRVRWADEPIGHIRDIAYFVPVETNSSLSTASGTTATSDIPATPPPPPSVERRDGEPVTMMITPIQLHYQHSVSPEESRYLRALDQGKLIGQRCPVCHQVYIPPRSACPTCGVPTTTEVELPDTGIVTTFCIVNVPFLGQKIAPPYVAAYILLDGADIPFLHLVLGCDAADVHMGMRVRAAWRPRAEWNTTLNNIDHFEPTGEPNAPYESYRRHL
jgi:uncharacterized OB-fold protein